MPTWLASTLSKPAAVLNGDEVVRLVDDPSGSASSAKTTVAELAAYAVDLVTPDDLGLGTMAYEAATVTSGQLKWTRESSSDPDWLYSDFTGLASSHSNVIVGVATGDSSGAVTRTTRVGAHALQSPDSSNRVEAFGQGALRWARFPERCTAIGSLSMQWLGCAVSTLAERHHDMWDPIVNGSDQPGDAGWDWNGLETNNPGIGTKIAAVTEAASSNDTEGNVGLGRDTLVELIRGIYNTAGGYKALSGLYSGSYNTGFGYGSGRDATLNSYGAYFGYFAGRLQQEGDYNTYVGARAGEDMVTGANNTIVGARGGSDGWTGVDGVVLLGYTAGTGVTPYDNAFLVQNSFGGVPLFKGDFSAQTLGLFTPAARAVLGQLHIYEADSGRSSVLASGNNLVIEGSNTGATIISSATGNGSIYFADPDSASPGYVQYNHNTNTLTLGASTAIATTQAITLPGAPTSALHAATKEYADQTGWRVSSSGAAVAVTGTTTETSAKSTTVPGGSLGANGVLMITCNCSHTNNANVKTIRVKYGGTTFLSIPAANQARTHLRATIQNLNATNSQIGGTNAGNASTFGQSTSAQVTGSVDTTADQTVEVTAELATGTDTVTVHNLIVEWHYSA